MLHLKSNVDAYIKHNARSSKNTHLLKEIDTP